MRRLLLVPAALLFFAATLPGLAADAPIARVPAVSESDPDPAVKRIFAEARARGTEPINLQLVMALAPALAKSNRDSAYAIRFDLKVPRPYRELTILRTAQLWDGDYEINQHIPMAKACGFSEAQIEGLAHWRDTGLFDAKQRALLAYVDAIAARPGRVDDATFAELARHFSANEIVELTLTAGRYMGTAMFTNALRLQKETDGRQAVIGKC